MRRHHLTWSAALVALSLLGCDGRRPATRAEPRGAPAMSARPSQTGASESLELTRLERVDALCRLLAARDTDCDQRITRDDEQPEVAAFPYSLEVGRGQVRLSARHEAAQLAQELVLSLGSSGKAKLDLRRVHASPSEYLSYRIQHHFWDGLTRRIDADPQSLERALADPKLGSTRAASVEHCPSEAQRCAHTRGAGNPDSPPPELGHVYVPSSDARALDVFARAATPGRIAVHALPERVTPQWLAGVTERGEHGLLSLALDASGRGRPFVVPGGRFNEMYGWDSFFIVWGLVQDPARTELARAMVDNHAYEIRHYGKILNANRTYYLTRSQPPFFTSSIAAVLARLPRNQETQAWLSQVFAAAVAEYRNVWNAAPRRLGLCDGDVCLARYFGEGLGEPPEVEAGHFAWFYQAHALAHGHCRKPGADRDSQRAFLRCSEELARDYRSHELKDRAIDVFFSHDRCVRESGHDTTFRWFDAGGERCADFVTVELSALLFKYEVDLARLLSEHFGGELHGERSAEFCARAERRARLIQRYHWDDASGLFLDYDVKNARRSSYLSATTLVPLFASATNVCGISLVSPEQARRVRDAALPALETSGGLAATDARSLAGVQRPKTLVEKPSGELVYVANERQWEAPNGWAPHQMLAWQGLMNFGFDDDARRLAERWLETIVENAAAYHGTVPEKFDVAERSHRVFAEYGNVNTEFSYIAEEGFGWMNASFVVGRRVVSERAK